MKTLAGLIILTRPIRINIDLKAVRSNIERVRQLAPSSKITACVKADAYGHNAGAIAETLESDVDAFAVASLEEGLNLRERGVEVPILLLEGFFDSSEIPEIARHDFWSVVHSKWQIDLLRSTSPDKKLSVWLKMDTGMHRLGFSPSDYLQAHSALLESDAVSSITHMTHFACSEELENPFTSSQLNCFEATLENLAGDRSAANSAAILAWQKSHLNWVRPGLMLYGVSPFDSQHNMADKLEPVMEFTSEVIAVRSIDKGETVGYNRHWTARRPSQIAVVAAGYGDGYPRNTAEGTPVLIKGFQAEVVGRVAMDMFTVDVTDLPNVEVGDSVELWGKSLSVNTVAKKSDYSAYELMTRLPPRVTRTYQS